MVHDVFVVKVQRLQAVKLPSTLLWKVKIKLSQLNLLLSFYLDQLLLYLLRDLQLVKLPVKHYLVVEEHLPWLLRCLPDQQVWPHHSLQSLIVGMSLLLLRKYLGRPLVRGVRTQGSLELAVTR